jgi:hypothetical protein
MEVQRQKEVLTAAKVALAESLTQSRHMDSADAITARSGQAYGVGLQISDKLKSLFTIAIESIEHALRGNGNPTPEEAATASFMV